MIEPAGNDSFDVLRDGRRLKANLTETAARAYVRVHAAPADRILMTEEDGYRSPVRR